MMCNQVLDKTALIRTFSCEQWLTEDSFRTGPNSGYDWHEQGIQHRKPCFAYWQATGL